MEEYVLYLDESSNPENTIFVVGGFLIKKSDVKKLEESIHIVKKCIWTDDYIFNNRPVLHCTNLNTINNNRNKLDKISKYIKTKCRFLDILCNKKAVEIKNIYDNVYIKLCETIKTINIVSIGCMLNLEQYRFLYDDYFNKKYELFFDVAVQQIIENYSYFLHRNKSVGSIVYESRNGQTESLNSRDSKMFNNFCKIKACNKGISFINQETIYENVRYFNLYSKYDDIAGLQLADFIAYEFMNRGHNLNINNYSEFTKRVFSCLYNGGYSLEDRDVRYYFGLRSLPFDYKLLLSQRDQIETLKKANKNLKNEYNKLSKHNLSLKESKQKLIAENNDLKGKLRKFEEKVKK